MMTPAERVVVESAIRWREGFYGPDLEHLGADLVQAVDALLAERSVPEGERREETIAWGELAEGDEVWSERVKRWYPVRSAVRHVGAPLVLVDLEGQPKVIQKSVSEPVKVRRGPAGRAVDMFASVLWSMPTSSETARSAEVAESAPDVATDPEASES